MNYSAVSQFNNIEMRAVIKFLFLQDKAPKEIHAILTETLPCFLSVRAKDLSAPASRRQQKYNDKYLLCVYNVEILLMTDSGHVRNM